jgi:PKD repeat protein
MITIYNSIKSKGLKALALGLMLTGSGWVKAQLSGTVTVGSGGTYTTFGAFATAFNASGVSGPLTVNVISNVTETAVVTFNNLFTNSPTATNRVTINGNNFIVSRAATSTITPEIFLFNGADFFTINQMTILNSGTASNVMGIRFTNNANDNVITNCTIEFSNLTATQTNTGAAYIAFSNSTTLGRYWLDQLNGWFDCPGVYTTGISGNGARNIIASNIMKTQANSPGPHVGIYETQNRASGIIGTNIPFNNTFKNNRIDNFANIAILSAHSNGTEIIGNDISRTNVTTQVFSQTSTTASVIQGIFSGSVGFNAVRAHRIDSNKIHDLPFLNATTTNANTTTHGIVCGLTNNGSNPSIKTTIKGNQISNIFSSTGGNVGIWAGAAGNCEISDNLISNLQNNSTSSSQYFGYTSGIVCDFRFYPSMFGFFSPTSWGGIGVNWGAAPTVSNDVINNRIEKCRAGGYFNGIHFFNYTLNSSTNSAAGSGNCHSNKISDNATTSSSIFFGEAYGIRTQLGVFSVSRNIVDSLSQTGNDPFANLYGFHAFTGTNGHQTWYSNILTHSAGSTRTVAFFCNNTNGANALVKQNTFNLNLNNLLFRSQTNLFTDGSGITTYDGNIFVDNTNYNWGFNSNGANIYRNNHVFVPNSPVTSFRGSYSGTNYTSWNTYKNANPGGQEGLVYENPNFVNQNARNFTPRAFRTQNNVQTTANAPVQFNGTNRNPGSSDRGAVERFADIAAIGSTFSVPATVCPGWTGNMTLNVRNLWADTATGFRVSFRSTGGPTVSTFVTKKILANDTHLVRFSVPIQLNTSGNIRITCFVDMPDDNVANDTISFTTTVLPAPGGGKYLQGTTPSKAIYRLNRPNDVTQINMPIYYHLTPPRAYTNADYWDGTGSSTGKKWTASVYGLTRAGILLPASIQNHATGTNNLEVKFETANAALEDSTITLVTKITDLVNNCDTLLRRAILIYPTINADFTFPTKICNGESVLFENKSTVRSGSLDFTWNFGTGVAGDTSNAPSPIFTFPSAGTYRVKLFARTVPWGFVTIDSADVVINVIPTVKFVKNNACEGQDLVFTNQSTPLIGTTSNWNWGNGTNVNNNNATVRYRYASPGSYLVTLTVNLNGCIGTATQRAYQFPTPKAAFDQTSGNCDNDAYNFTNKSTISSGTFGPYWNFGDNTYSTEDDASKVFGTPGTKNVKLVVTSLFGCKDSVSKPISVLESPKVAFINTPACSRTATQFTNTTPVVGGAGGAVKTYSWDFGDGGTSILASPSRSWSTLGPKNVKFDIELMNGCKGSFSKVLNVGVQPKASFTAQNVCLGKPMVFDNTTTWPQGDITWLWNFGDGVTSTSSKPVHTYTKAFSPNVTLYASIAGGCTDSIVIPVTIFEGPRTCDFTVATDYAFGFYGVKLNPLNASTGVAGGQDKVEYSWIFQGGGTNKTSGVNAETQFDFQTDGAYDVTMRARSTTAPFCECSITKKVVMNRAAVKDLETTGVAVFPNPNNGQFNLSVKSSFGKNLNIVITNMSGAVVKQINTENNGMISINSGNLSDGVYMVRVSSGENTAVRKITISK